MNRELQHAFNDIGARLVEDRFGRAFELDIVSHEQDEAYQIQRR